MRRTQLLLSIICFLSVYVNAQKSYQLMSPDQKLMAEVSVGEEVTITLLHEETIVLAPSRVSMILQNGEVFGGKGEIQKVTRASVDKVIPSPFYKKTRYKMSIMKWLFISGEITGWSFVSMTMEWCTGLNPRSGD